MLWWTGNDFTAQLRIGRQHTVKPNQIEPEGSEIERKGMGGTGSLLGRRTPNPMEAGEGIAVSHIAR
jgi:hypothetical protein